MSRAPSAAVLFGYGSIGRRHAAALAEWTDHFAIVEPNESARTQAQEQYPTAAVFEGLPALDAAGFPWGSAVGVIATWGPSHAPIFHQLADRGVRHILCEKPMATSMHDAWVMRDRAEQEGIVVAVHHYLRYVRLRSALEALADEHGLGSPIAMLVEGGAACLLTNGLHWIDFAIDLFGALPETVISTGVGAALNPRSPDLHLYGGTTVWSFSEQREAIISFSNRSSLAPVAHVYFRDAVMEVADDLSVVARRRDPHVVRERPAITRTGAPEQVVFRGSPPGTVHYLQGLRAALQEVTSGSSVTASAGIGEQAVAACVAALVASREGRRIELPVTPDSVVGRERWPIS